MVHGSWAQPPVEQSSGQVAASSPASQVPLGQVLGQSAGQVEVVSPLSHEPLPQQEPQSAGHDEQVSALHMPSPQPTMPVVFVVVVVVVVVVVEPPVPVGAPPLPDAPTLLDPPAPVFAPPSVVPAPVPAPPLGDNVSPVAQAVTSKSSQGERRTVTTPGVYDNSVVPTPLQFLSAARARW